MIKFVEIGLAKSAVTLCDRGHATMPESVFYSGNGPFESVGLSGVSYCDAPMFDNARMANPIPRHSSLRGVCSERMI